MDRELENAMYDHIDELSREIKQLTKIYNRRIELLRKENDDLKLQVENWTGVATGYKQELNNIEIERTKLRKFISSLGWDSEQIDEELKYIMEV